MKNSGNEHLGVLLFEKYSIEPGMASDFVSLRLRVRCFSVFSSAGSARAFFHFFGAFFGFYGFYGAFMGLFWVKNREKRAKIDKKGLKMGFYANEEPTKRFFLFQWKECSTKKPEEPKNGRFLRKNVKNAKIRRKFAENGKKISKSVCPPNKSSYE